MAQKIVQIPEVGEVLLAKRRGAKHFKLSILPDGRVRVGLPAWVPYSAGINFARTRADWIIKHSQQQRQQPLKTGDRIGKSYRLYINHDPNLTRISSRITANAVLIKTGGNLLGQTVQKKAAEAAERALKKEAEKLLPQRLETLARRHNFSYKSLRIKKLTSRWGSCSHEKSITLNYFLMQLPWDLIDYVILHELLHTRFLNHSADFWRAFEEIKPDARQSRKEVNTYKPVLIPAKN